MPAAMALLVTLLLGALCASLAACRGADSQSSARPSEPIKGTERIAWDQPASSPAELATLRYAIYVDGVRSEIPDVSCKPSGAVYACAGRLPTMTPGSHVIEIATFKLDGSHVVEGPRSPAFTVTVSSTTEQTGR